ncbi:MAG: type I methionyl aminopeptidase, partial [Rhodospirillales bacterium]|nr:type I methionyl aminopeptidase [Rhodospirillales bacterium]
MNDNTSRETAPRHGRSIKIHGPEDFAAMRRAGRLAAETLDFITPHVKAGVTTGALDTLCHDFITDHDAVPAPLNYRGFPKSICTSINHVICHGIPGARELRDGDALNIDVTVILDGWHGDTSRMFLVGKAGVKARRLVDVTFDAMWRGIKAVRPGATVGDIGHAIQTLAEAEREHARKKALFARKVISGAAVDDARAEFQRARARLTAARASVTAQQSAVAASRAQMRMARAERTTAKAQV